jgi:aryl-alcohol dehydrogenase-like predicted oxidoreductase
MESERISIGGDLPVRRVGFGAMRVSGRDRWFGEPDDRPASLALLRRAVELGVQLIDTAFSYGEGVSETLIAEALHPYPDDLVIATKGGMHRIRADTFTDGRPAVLRRQCEESLARLRLERIDLYQLHRVDPAVPLEESVGTLAELQAEGKIRHIGLSNVDAEQLARAQAVAPIASVQNAYSIGNRKDDPLVDECERQGLAYLPYGPLSGADPATALVWLLRRSPAICPIPGTSSLEHLEANMKAAAKA